jgi:hypothetical protein
LIEEVVDFFFAWIHAPIGPADACTLRVEIVLSVGSAAPEHAVMETVALFDVQPQRTDCLVAR